MIGVALQCKIVTPNKLVIDQEVDYVDIPALEGKVGVLPDHAPLVALIAEEGELQILNDGRLQKYLIKGGVAEIRNNIVSVLTNSAEEIKETA